MTLATNTSSITQQGNGATTVWQYGFLIQSASQCVVQLTDPNFNVTTLAANQYSVTGMNNPQGGTVTYPLSGNPLATGWAITVSRQVPLIQLASIANQGGFYPAVYEAALDYLTMVCQQLASAVALCIAVPVGSGLTPSTYLTQINNSVTNAANSATAAAASATSASGYATNSANSAAAAASSATAAAAAAASITSPIPITNGGTGSTSAGAARTALGITPANIGAAASGANSDITSLSGLTTPLSIAQGGTGNASGNISKIQSIAASVASNALTLTYNGGTLDFRNATLTNGAPISNVVVAANSIVIPSGATLGTISATQARLVLLIAYNGGSPVLCVANLAGGLNLDETTLISPTTISAGATANNIIYSASAVSANSPFRVVGFVGVTETTAGTWATAPTIVQGTGGQALAALSSLGYGQVWQASGKTSGVTYYNTMGKPMCILMKLDVSFTGSLVIGGVTVFSDSTNAQYRTSAFAIVPPGMSYVVTTNSTWTEFY